MGIARLVLLGLVVLAFVALIVFGVLSLFGGLGSDSSSGSGSGVETATTPTRAAGSSPAPAPAAERVPTVLVECLRQECPTVFLKVTGGDVLFDREMAQDERFQSFDPKVDVVLADSAAVRVQVNGTVRPPVRPGEREEFTVSRD
ncbi:hypothetical protein [Streptosporangium longisporum]|uniref:DUF4115 domain-containing protein n=1 Tax=Streptosporangium longisporum TaxID=46187 RepID=A0ABN3XVV5_9ACTN